METEGAISAGATDAGTGEPASSCGNGIVESSEECDATDLATQTCASLGYDGGDVACSSDCTFDATGCHSCGDGVRQEGEVCDGDDLGEEICGTQGASEGTLACSDDCSSFDTSACTECGNGVLGASEQCDGNELAGQTCDSLGLGAGTLPCSNACPFDSSGGEPDQACGIGGDPCTDSSECCLGICLFNVCA